MLTMLLAPGGFTGVMRESGMLAAMAHAGASHLPRAMASHFPFLMCLLSMPLSLVFDPDSFYFGVLPVVAEVARGFNVPPVQVGQAALPGQMGQMNHRLPGKSTHTRHVSAGGFGGS